MTILPRPSNQPREVLRTLATEAITTHGGPSCARVFYKYDCACGRRVTIPTPNLLPARAQCSHCHAWTIIVSGGFMLQARVAPSVSWDDPGAYVRKTYAVVPEAAIAENWSR